MKCKTCGTERGVGEPCIPCKNTRWRLRAEARRGRPKLVSGRPIKNPQIAKLLVKAGYVVGATRAKKKTRDV